MHRLINPLWGSALLALLLVPADIRGQERTSIVFSDDEVETIKGNAEHYLRLLPTILIADMAIEAYLEKSTQTIEQGHRQGFAQFRVWYRKYKDRRQTANHDVLKSLFGTALMGGLNLIFPGSGIFSASLKKYMVQGYKLAFKHVGTVKPGDVNQFLDRHQSVIEDHISKLQDIPQLFRNDHPDVIFMAQWEFVFEKATSTAYAGTPDAKLGPDTRRMLAELGVPEHGPATRIRIKERVLEDQIRAVYENNENMKRMNLGPWILDVFARTAALRHLYGGQPDRYCAEERQRLKSFLRSPDCR